MKGRILPLGAALIIFGTAVVIFALWQNLRTWEE